MKFYILSSCALFCIFAIRIGSGAPLVDDVNSGHYVRDKDYAPAPYDFSYAVNDPPSNNFYGHEEKGGDAGGRTEGKYFVLLPDGRLMTVVYYVDQNSGFVPKITFSQPNFNPFTQTTN